MCTARLLYTHILAMITTIFSEETILQGPSEISLLISLNDEHYD